MKLKTLSALCLAASSLLIASSAMAWESENGAHSTSANVALSTNYMWRGVTQSDENAAVSGGFDYGHTSGVYLGTWGSNVNFDSATSMELDFYAGFSNDIGDTGLAYDVGLIRYAYPGEKEINWTEYYSSLSYSVLTGFVAYTNEYGGTDKRAAIYYNLSAAYDLGDSGVGLAAAIGYYDIDSKNDAGDYYDVNVENAAYTDWSVGISAELVGLGLDLSYIDNNVKDNDSTVVFTLSKSM